MDNQLQPKLPPLQKGALIYAGLCACLSTLIFLFVIASDVMLIFNLVFDYADTVVDWAHIFQSHLLFVIASYFVIEFDEMVDTF